MRVAVTQFATSSSTEESISTCLRNITKAAACQPTLIVLPMIFNHLGGHQQYQKHSKDSVNRHQFIEQLCQQAVKHQCYIYISLGESTELQVWNGVTTDINKASIHQKIHSDQIPSRFCIISPLGKVCSETGSHDKMSTALTHLGFLSGNDSTTYGAARHLAKSGVQLICNSIATQYFDQLRYHDPTRALENNLFIATANTVGFQKPVRAGLAENEQAINNGDNAINGCGQSRIISPQGEILASLNDDEEGFAYADINVKVQTHPAKPSITFDSNETMHRLVGLNHKYRPDGTCYDNQLRPELYSIEQHTNKQVNQTDITQSNTASLTPLPATVNVAIFATYKANEQAIDDVCHYIENNLTDIIQLPELFFVDDKSTMANASLRSDLSLLSQLCIEKMSKVLRPCQYVCTSLLIDDQHQAVLISNNGVIALQSQLLPCNRHAWTKLGNGLATYNLVLEQGSIKLAMLTADDAFLPETINLAAKQGIHLLLLALDIQEAGDVFYSLSSRAAEFNLCIVAASKEKNFSLEQPKKQTIYSKNKDKIQKSTGLIANVKLQPGVLPRWQTTQATQFSNKPLVKWQFGKITKAVIHPIFSG